MWTIYSMVELLQGLIVLDLLINLFFHLVQLRRYCIDEVLESLTVLVNRFSDLDRVIRESERTQRQLHESFRKYIEEDDDHEE